MKLTTLCIAFFFFSKIASGQSMVVNTIDSIFYVNQGSLCGYSWAGLYCLQGTDGVFSIALHRDTLYVLTHSSKLYRMTLGAGPTTCTLLTTFPENNPFGSSASVNSMTADKNGILYAADGITTDIIRYDPRGTSPPQVIGRVGWDPGGDMIFYKDKLLLATAIHGIMEVNISNPELSTQYMPPDGNNFFGLFSAPFTCTENKYYGSYLVAADTTAFVELDLENKIVGPVICKIPKMILDGASQVDDGSTAGVTIDTLWVRAPCGDETVADIRVVARSAATGQLTYLLDGSATNTTGFFTNVPVGNHSIRVTNSINCFKDSNFVISHGLSAITVDKQNPLSCEVANGSITINASSGNPPVLYKLGSGILQANPHFSNLPGGAHTVRIQDAGGCVKDTIIYLTYQIKPAYFSSFTVQPTICNNKNGKITINLPNNINPADVTASINNSVPQPALNFQNLDEGDYNISLFFQNSCRYDTLISIERLTNERPLISLAITDQKCLQNNGAVRVFLTGDYGPFSISFNNGIYTGNTTYLNLAAGSYSLSIQDKDLCRFDTFATIKPYVVFPYVLDTVKTDPTCKLPKSGTIEVSISGTQSPYHFVYNNNVYPSGSRISDLPKGIYTVSIRNSDNCELEKITFNVDLKLDPECDFVFVPTAFTPNGNGLNDVVSPHLGAGVTDFEFKIYHRNGQPVFSTTTRGKGWDGKIKGAIQSSGVFVWTLKYRTVNHPARRLIKGTLTLIR